MNYQILRLPDVKKQTGLSRSTLYKLINENKFPRQILLGSRSVGWEAASVQNWIKQRLAASRMEG